MMMMIRSGSKQLLNIQCSLLSRALVNNNMITWLAIARKITPSIQVRLYTCLYLLLLSVRSQGDEQIVIAKYGYLDEWMGRGKTVPEISSVYNAD